MIVQSWDEMWYAGVGAMLWSNLDGAKCLVVMVPSPGDVEVGRCRHVVLHVSRQPDNWARSGPVIGWDGNEDAPTLHPSIDVPGLWHGFVVNGWLCMDQNGRNLVRPQYGVNT